MAAQHDADVIIVGARAAGAATAMLLARAGLSVLLLDRDRPGTDTLSTHALMRGAVVQLNRWGLLGRVAAAGTPPVRTTTFHYTAGTVTIPIKPGAGVDALYAPRRTVLDPILVQAATEAGATVRHRTSVLGLLTDRGRVVGVEARGRGGPAEALTAPLVIGADGRRSTVAHLVGAPLTYRAEGTGASTYGYFHGLADQGYEWAYRPGAAAGFIPTDDGLTCVFANGLPGRIGRGGIAVLRSVVAAGSPDLAERLASATLVSPVRTFVGQRGYLRQCWGPGWALVGDAGSWKDPISAHGLTDAFRDAEGLSRAALGVLAGESSAASAFGRYQAIRDRLSLPILRGGEEIAAMAWDDERIVALLRQLNAAMNEELEVIEGFEDPWPAPRGLPARSRASGAGAGATGRRRAAREPEASSVASLDPA